MAMTEETQAEPKSVEQRDLEWLANVYRGDKEKDLTVRAVLAGMVFGGLMSLSNLYVGLKSGWGLGVDIAAVVVIFAVFKALREIGIVRREFGLMENTMTMTVAVAASWISSAGLVSAVPALTLLTGYQFVWWQLTLFIAVILYLGLFMAIPLKRQMIQIDSLRFPANIPTGETLLVMYSHGGQAMKKAMSLGIASLLGMLVAGLRDGLGWIPAQLYLPWRLHRIALGKLTLSLEPSLIFISIGALFGMKVGLSMLFGLVLNYGILAPRLIEEKIVHHLPPKLIAAALPKLPLAVKAGQTFTVKLDEAVGGPELSTPEELKADPELASTVRTSVLRYTWTDPTKYTDLAGLERDLNAKTLQDGSPNPLHGVITASRKLNKSKGVEMLCLEAPAAIDWEAKLSLPDDQPSDMLHALGFKTSADVTEATAKVAQAKSEIAKDGEMGLAEAAKALADSEKALAEQSKDAMPKIGGFRNISAWSLWPGATVLVVGGLLALAFQWRTLGRTFAGIFSGLGGNRNAPKGPLDHIEIPMTWFVFGFLVTGSLAVVMLTWIFHIQWWMGVIAVMLTFFLSAVASRAGAEIGINPIGALGKVTQLTYGALAPGNITANLMTAGVTAGAACSCSDTIGNLKVGHMVGANPRRQFIAQLFGVLAGSLLAVPAYFILVPDASALGGDKFPAPSALVWMGVAKVLSLGLHTLPPSAVWAMGVALVVGVIIVVVDYFFPKARPYTPSPAALGIAMTIPAYTSFAMFLGALIAWILEKKAAKWNDMYTIPIASGCIAGESIMGVILAALMAMGLMQ
ncbi:MAG: OPT family oligopeptide transporter [Planctomycetota bacterium]